MIAFYIGITGFACTIYYRRELLPQRQELLLHRRRPDARRRDPLLPAGQERDRTLRPGQLRIGQLLVRDRAAAGDRGLLPRPRLRADVSSSGARSRPSSGASPRSCRPASSRAKRRPPGPTGVAEAEWARSWSATTARPAATRRSTRRSSWPSELGDEVVVVFGYAPPGLWGGEIAEHEEAIEELGEKVMAEAKAAGRRARASRSRSSWSPKRAAEALIEVADAARRADDRRRQLRRPAAEGHDPRLDPEQAPAPVRAARCCVVPAASA